MANYTPQQIEEILQEFFDVVGTRQYIGARYVPLFGRRGESSIDWNNSAPYEPLTIVNHQGNSYTSRTYVPAGVDIANQDYWAMTGQYNAQVEAYRQEVIQLQEDWADWKTDTEGDLSDWKDQTVEDFTEAIDNLPGIIPSSAFDETNTVKAYIDNQRIIKNTNRYFVFIGDSYSMLQDNWVDRATQLLGLSSSQWVKIGANSRGFRGDPNVSGDMTWLTLLQENMSLIPDVSAVTDMVILGGTNDTYNYDSSANIAIYSAIGQFFGWCQRTFPQSTVYHLGYVGFTTNPNWLGWRQNVIRLYNEAETRFRNVFAIVDMWRTLHYAGELTDQVHPNSEGTKKVAAALVGYLTGVPGYFQPTNTATDIAITPSGILQGGSLSNANMHEYYDGTNVTVDMASEQYVNVTLSTPITLTCNDQWQEVFTLGTGWYVGGVYAPAHTVIVHMYNSTNGMLSIPANMRISGNKVYFQIARKRDNSTQDLSYGVSQMKIQHFTYTAPAIAN